MPPAISQRLVQKARVTDQLSRITRIQPMSMVTVSKTAIVLSTMGTEMDLFSFRNIGDKDSRSLA